MTMIVAASALRWMATRLDTTAERLERHTSAQLRDSLHHGDEAHYERVFAEMRARIGSRVY